MPDTKLVQQSMQLTLLIMALSFLVANLTLWVMGGEWELMAATEPQTPSLVVGVIVPLALTLLAYTMLDTPSAVIRWIAWPVVLAATVGSALSNTLLEDFSVTAQLHHFVPTILAAYCLCRQGAWLIYVTAVITHGAWAWALGQGTGFVGDWIMTSGVMAVITYSLATIRSNQASTHATLADQMRRDTLTGLLNRQAFDRTVPHPAATPPPDGDAMLILDIDHFKDLNDTHGHPAGDAVLQQVANTLKAIVDEGGHAFRVGGDEFVVFLPNCTRQAAEMLAQRVVYSMAHDPFEVYTGQGTALGNPATDTATTIQATCSVGVGHWPSDQRYFTSLYTAADAALYVAKDRGRCTYASTTTLTEGSAQTEVKPTTVISDTHGASIRNA